MEGPTPVSALIHAATMVAAGVYMLVRVAFIVQASAQTLTVISWIGAITALMAALIATQQDDIKRILAYSTLSQLGYMITAVGLGSNEAAMFHLFTHAFFKALLFLGAGAMIIMLHHEQDIWRMGGLKNRLPVTFITFAVGALALIGCPPFSGFFSKDAILLVAFQKNGLIFSVELFTAFLDRVLCDAIACRCVPWKAARRRGKKEPRGALGNGWSARSSGDPIGSRRLWILRRDIPANCRKKRKRLLWFRVSPLPALVLGVLFATFYYRNRAQEPFDIPLLRRAFYIDEFYRWLIDRTQENLARLCAFIDRWVVDAGAVGGASSASWGTGALLRFLQVGNLQAYAFLFGIGIVALIYFAVIR